MHLSYSKIRSTYYLYFVLLYGRSSNGQGVNVPPRAVEIGQRLLPIFRISLFEKTSRPEKHVFTEILRTALCTLTRNDNGRCRWPNLSSDVGFVVVWTWEEGERGHLSGIMYYVRYGD